MYLHVVCSHSNCHICHGCPLLPEKVGAGFAFERRQITFCENDVFTHKGQQWQAPCVYRDTLLSLSGCDSIIEYVINRATTYLFEQQQQCYEGHSTTWHGRELSHPGVYYDSLTSVSGCDSVYKLTLTVLPGYHFTEAATICLGEQYSWRGHTYGNGGIYYDSITSSLGTDSIYELKLKVIPSSKTVLNATLCEGDVYTYHGRTYSQDAIIRDTLINQGGCDSIIEIHLHVNPTYHFEESDFFHQGKSYLWHGRELTAPGVHWDSLVTINGCDSVYRLTLERKPSYLFRDTAVTCSNQPYHWHGEVYTETGIYEDRYTTIHGADSVYELHLTVLQAYQQRQIVSLCAGDYFEYRGQQLTAPQVFVDSLTSSLGCDSIIEIVLLDGGAYYYEESANIPHGETYTWHGQNLTASGIYWDKLLTQAGCDSIYRLTLEVYPVSYYVDSMAICQGETYTWRGETYNATGIYRDSYQDRHGLDSIYELRLTVHPTYLYEQEVVLCPGEVFTYNGEVHNAPEIFYDTLLSSHGCDSICRFIISPARSYNTESTVYICDEPSYEFHGKTITRSGNYLVRFQTVDGCDSLFRLNIHFGGCVRRDTIIYVCPDDLPFNWNGRGYTQPGNYLDSLVTYDRCDTDVIRYHIRIAPVYLFEERDTACVDYPYLWHGQALTTSGTYYDSLLTRGGGCDSVYRLHLVVPTYAGTAVVDDVCAEDNTFSIRYSYTGSAPGTYSIYYEEKALQAGFKNIIGAKVTPDQLTVALPSVRPDIYAFSLYLGDSVCPAANHAVPLSLMVRFPSSILEQHFQDVVGVRSARYNGGYTFSDYQWYVNDVPVYDQHQGNLYLPGMLRPGDEVVLEAVRSGDDYPMRTCPLLIVDAGSLVQHSDPILLSAIELSEAGGKARVRVWEQATYTLYDVTGRTLQQLTLQPGEYHIDLPTPAGFYLVDVRTHAQQATIKIGH